ncbi:MAG TPA: hypothetical protein VMU51_31910 [Mycobacteriales bacterium]|nr:hypothetical protein [Mycobacteriales bacterium]
MRRRLGLLTAALVAVPLALAGCGSSGGADDGIASAGGPAQGSAAGTATPAADPQERRLQLTRCLRDHGVNISDSGGDRGALATMDPKVRQAALEACQQYLTGVDRQALLTPENKQKMLQYLRCLRGHGVDVADPDPNTGLPQKGDYGKFLNPDQKMKDAMKACEQFRPGVGRGTG